MVICPTNGCDLTLSPTGGTWWDDMDLNGSRLRIWIILFESICLFFIEDIDEIENTTDIHSEPKTSDDLNTKEKTKKNTSVFLLFQWNDRRVPLRKWIWRCESTFNEKQKVVLIWIIGGRSIICLHLHTVANWIFCFTDTHCAYTPLGVGKQDEFCRHFSWSEERVKDYKQFNVSLEVQIPKKTKMVWAWPKNELNKLHGKWGSDVETGQKKIAKLKEFARRVLNSTDMRLKDRWRTWTDYINGGYRHWHSNFAPLEEESPRLVLHLLRAVMAVQVIVK